MIKIACGDKGHFRHCDQIARQNIMQAHPKVKKFGQENLFGALVAFDQMGTARDRICRGKGIGCISLRAALSRFSAQGIVGGQSRG